MTFERAPYDEVADWSDMAEQDADDGVASSLLWAIVGIALLLAFAALIHKAGW